MTKFINQVFFNKYSDELDLKVLGKGIFDDTFYFNYINQFIQSELTSSSLDIYKKLFTLINDKIYQSSQLDLCFNVNNKEFEFYKESDIYSDVIFNYQYLRRKSEIIQRFIKKYFHKYKNYLNDVDLMLQPIDKETCLSLYCKKRKNIFQFSKNDLFEILKTNLQHQESLKAEPIFPKNPYNNCIFNILQLELIYDFLLKSGSFNPKKHTILTLFREANYNLEVFKFRASRYLNRLACHNFCIELNTINLAKEFYNFLSILDCHTCVFNRVFKYTEDNLSSVRYLTSEALYYQNYEETSQLLRKKINYNIEPVLENKYLKFIIQIIKINNSLI